MTDQASHPRGSSRKTLAIVLSLVGIVFLLCMGSCGGLLFWGLRTAMSTLPALQTSANAFLDDLGAGRVEAAYARTSVGFQANQTLAQFRAMVDQYPALKEHTSRSVNWVHVSQQLGGPIGTVQATVLSAHNSLSFTLTFVQEGEEWKVERFAVP
jgi:hypothetical protein